MSCKDNENNNLLERAQDKFIAAKSIDKTEDNFEFAQDLTLTFEHNGKSKIGQINDPDGYSNLRLEKSSKSKIISKILINHYFFYLPNKTENWYKVKDLKGNIGFIHKSRISEVSDKKLYNISYTDQTTEDESRKDSIVKYNDLEKAFENLWEIELNYKSLRFESKTSNSITFNEENIEVKFVEEKTNPNLTLINNKTWGTESNKPKYQYKSIEILDNGQTYSIPKDKFSDLYEPTLDKGSIKIFTNINNQTILKLSNSDGAGSYIAVFIIEQQQVIKRIVYTPF